MQGYLRYYLAKVQTGSSNVAALGFANENTHLASKLGYTRITLSKVPTSVGIFDRIKLMQKGSLLFPAFVLATIGAILYYLGNIFYLPWTYWWYDVVLHFLVSATGGICIFWGMFDSGLIFRGRFENRVGSILLVLICVLAVGVGWDIWEYANNLLDNTEGYALDTMNDLILDSAGALLAVVFASRKNING